MTLADGAMFNTHTPFYDEKTTTKKKLLSDDGEIKLFNA